MQIVLRQEFLLGRYHATPWRVNPFDDPHGEWPPSPWRLLRAVTARWYQYVREADVSVHVVQLESLQAALCQSSYSFHLPVDGRKGTPLRQYHPTELGIDPPNFKAHQAIFDVEGDDTEVEKKLKATGAVSWNKVDGGWSVEVGKKAAKKAMQKVEKQLGPPSSAWRGLNPDAGHRRYGTSLTQDNYWCVSPQTPIWWHVDGEPWTPELVSVLEHCVARITYFGRAEALTSIRLAKSHDVIPEPNCTLAHRRVPGGVPVVLPQGGATREDIERTTDDPAAVKRAVPPGAQVLYAVRPHRPAARELRGAQEHRPDCHLLQFALGWNVPPDARRVVRLTSRFRGAVIRELLKLRTSGATASWRHASSAVREAIADMTGKDAKGNPLKGHRHTEFFAWCQGRQPTRLLVWRGSRAFDADEQQAILLAASREVSWTDAGSDVDEWKVRLIPMDRDVPHPPGFDERASRAWVSVTPYVPARHNLRGGKERASESTVAQIQRELQCRGIAEHVDVQLIQSPSWVSVHVPRRESGKRAFAGDRRGQMVRLCFPTPVAGPIRLGHSSSFGLGLFRPTDEA